MKKLFKFIGKNRYMLSIVFTVIFSVLGFAFNYSNFTFMQWITNTEKFFTPWITFKISGLIFVCYELFMIITNEKKNMSLLGAFVLTFSGVTLYNISKIDSLLIGSFIIVLLEKLLKNKENKFDFVYVFLLIISSILYSYTYIQYAIAFGFIFIALAIFVLLKNKSNIKNKKIKLIVSLIVSLFGMIITKLFLPNNYNDEVIFYNGSISLLFSYIYSFLLPFKNFENSNLLSSYFGLWPVPLLLSLYYIYKNEKHLEFLLPITLVNVMETVFCLMKFPNTENSILNLNMVGNLRMIHSVELLNIFVVFYFMTNVNEKLFNMKALIRVTIVILLLFGFIAYPNSISGRGYLVLYTVIAAGQIFLFLNNDKKEYNNVYLFVLFVLSLISGIPVLLG